MPKTYLFLLFLFAACQIAETPKPRVYRIPTLDDYIRVHHKYKTLKTVGCKDDFDEILLRNLWKLNDDHLDTTNFTIVNYNYCISHIWGKHGHIRWVHTDFLLDLLETGIVPVDTSHQIVPISWIGKFYNISSFIYKDFIVYELRDSQKIWAGSLMQTPHAQALAAIVDAHHAQYATTLDSAKYRFKLARLLHELQSNSSGYEARRYLMQFSMRRKMWEYRSKGSRKFFTTYFQLTAVDGEEWCRADGYTLFSEPSFEQGVIKMDTDEYLSKDDILTAAQRSNPTFIFFKNRVMQGSCQPVYYFLLYYFDENYQLEDWKLVVPKFFVRASWQPDGEAIDFSAPYSK